MTKIFLASIFYCISVFLFCSPLFAITNAYLDEEVKGHEIEKQAASDYVYLIAQYVSTSESSQDESIKFYIKDKMKSEYDLYGFSSLTEAPILHHFVVNDRAFYDIRVGMGHYFEENNDCFTDLPNLQYFGDAPFFTLQNNIHTFEFQFSTGDSEDFSDEFSIEAGPQILDTIWFFCLGLILLLLIRVMSRRR